MAFPPEVQTVTLRMGPVLDVAGNPVAGATLQVTLATRVMILSDGAILPGQVFVRTGADGRASVTVAATDSTGLDTTGFTYRVYATGITTDGAIDVPLPAAAPDVDIEDLAPVPASTGTVWVPPGAFLEAPEPGATGDVLTYGVDGDPVWQAPSTQGGPHAATHAAGGTDPVTLTSGQVTGLAPVATTGAYTDLTGRPTFGTAAAAATTDFATAAQGATADTASQPGHTHAAGDVTTGTLDIARIPTGQTGTTVPLGNDTRFLGQSAVNVVPASGATRTLPATHAWHDVTMDQACTFTFAAPAAAGYSFGLVLRGAFTPTLPASVRWADGTPPTYTTPSLYVFSTVDGGTTWLGSQVGKAFA